MFLFGGVFKDEQIDVGAQTKTISQSIQPPKTVEQVKSDAVNLISGKLKINLMLDLDKKDKLLKQIQNAKTTEEINRIMKPVIDALSKGTKIQGEFSDFAWIQKEKLFVGFNSETKEAVAVNQATGEHISGKATDPKFMSDLQTFIGNDLIFNQIRQWVDQQIALQKSKVRKPKQGADMLADRTLKNKTDKDSKDGVRVERESDIAEGKKHQEQGDMQEQFKGSGFFVKSAKPPKNGFT